MIISFINQKGGVGKSTITINVADYLTRQGHKVLVVDTDNQNSVTDWASLRIEAPFPVVQMARENVAKEIMRMAMDYEFTLVDCPPRAEAIARSCIIASDLVVLPLEPSGFSNWASDVTVSQVREAMELKEALKCGFVVSRKLGNSVIGRDIRAMIADKGMHVFENDIKSRVAYAEHTTIGQTLFEYGQDKEAEKEIINLTKEIISYGQELSNSEETHEQRAI